MARNEDFELKLSWLETEPEWNSYAIDESLVSSKMENCISFNGNSYFNYYYVTQTK